MEYPKWLYLDSVENGIIVSDAEEEAIARKKGFADFGAKTEEAESVLTDGDEREALKAALKEAGVSFGGNTSTAKLRDMVASLR